jgi:hypothetical protein
LTVHGFQDVDARDKRGHDGVGRKRPASSSIGTPAQANCAHGKFIQTIAVGRFFSFFPIGRDAGPPVTKKYLLLQMEAQ